MNTKWIWVGVGLVMVLLGVVWMLQGFDVLGGSGMSGSSMWAVIGTILAVLGVAVVAFGLTRRSGTNSR